MMNSIGIRLSPQDKQILAAYAKQNDTTISQIVRKLIREYVGGVSSTDETSTAASSAAQGRALAYQKEEKRK